MDSTAPTQTRTAVSWLATAPADRVDAFQQAYSDAYVELKRLARGQLRRVPPHRSSHPAPEHPVYQEHLQEAEQRTGQQ